LEHWELAHNQDQETMPVALRLRQRPNIDIGGGGSFRGDGFLDLLKFEANKLVIFVAISVILG
jgi:hypothetical protein